MEIPFTGGCACGMVRFRCNAEPLAMYHCHCSGCRGASGALFASLLVLSCEDVDIAGDTHQFNRPQEGDKHGKHTYCGKCGSPLFASSATMPHLLLVRAGALDKPSLFRPVADIWTIDAHPEAPMDRHIPKVYKTPPLLGNNLV